MSRAVRKNRKERGEQNASIKALDAEEDSGTHSMASEDAHLQAFPVEPTPQPEVASSAAEGSEGSAPQAEGSAPKSADLFRASSLLDLPTQPIQHPTYQSIRTAKPNHANQPTNQLTSLPTYQPSNIHPTNQ